MMKRTGRVGQACVAEGDCAGDGAALDSNAATVQKIKARIERRGPSMDISP
jgi:hypothetical protein